MDDLLKLGFIFAPAGYLLLYAGAKIELFNNVADLMGTTGVFGTFTGNMILLYFGIEKLFPEVQTFSTLIQFFLLMVVLVGAAIPIFYILKQMQSEPEEGDEDGY
jgi:DMSO reductase anchor subunit